LTRRGERVYIPIVPASGRPHLDNAPGARGGSHDDRSETNGNSAARQNRRAFSGNTAHVGKGKPDAHGEKPDIRNTILYASHTAFLEEALRQAELIRQKQNIPLSNPFGGKIAESANLRCGIRVWVEHPKEITLPLQQKPLRFSDAVEPLPAPMADIALCVAIPKNKDAREMEEILQSVAFTIILNESYSEYDDRRGGMLGEIVPVVMRTREQADAIRPYLAYLLRSTPLEIAGLHRVRVNFGRTIEEEQVQPAVIRGNVQDVKVKEKIRQSLGAYTGFIKVLPPPKEEK